MKTVLMVVALLLLAPLASAKTHSPCKVIKGDCVGMALESDGYFWLVKRAMVNGAETWVPIKKADCPAYTAAHENVTYARDEKYGEYACKYGVDTEPRRTGIRGFIQTHKVLLITDGFILAASAADAASTVHCQHISIQCRETNFFLPPRPSNLQVYGFAAGTAAGTIAFDHWFKHGLNNSDFGLLYMGDVALTMYGYGWGIDNNIHTSENLQQARAALQSRVVVK